MTKNSTATLARTPLANWHAAHEGRLVDFAGWAMPVQYGSIVEEHTATRSSAGLFDVSHMGRLSFSGGADLAEHLDRLLTRSILDQRVGQVRYSLVCNESGGVLDDILVTRWSDSSFDMVVNASNRVKLVSWFEQQLQGTGVGFEDHTEATAMIAVQGPQARELVYKHADSDLSGIRYYNALADITVAGAQCNVSRTGYTGEDGFELVCPADGAERVWETLVSSGAQPCGLASRDTLRLEAGMPLYGHELSETINPLQASLDFAVSFEKRDGRPRDFIGRDALVAAKQDEQQTTRVGLRVEGRRPPREGYTVLDASGPCGTVTSGTAAPTLGYSIAMAYVAPRCAKIGTTLKVDVRGTEASAEVVDLPFYKR